MGINEETGWYDEDNGGGAGGNGGGHRRRRADKPSKMDKAVKKAVQKAPGGSGGGDCLIQAIGLFGLGMWIVNLITHKIIERTLNHEHRGT